jgi:TRAP-type mannitol/chloroaromatic compound transport system permease large subunit
MDWLIHHLALILFFILAAALFTGFPVAFVLGGIAIMFGALGMLFDVFAPVQFFNLLPRVWGAAASNPILVAVPMFICCTACRCCCGASRADWRCRSP